MEQINNHSPLPWEIKDNIVHSHDGLYLMSHDDAENMNNAQFFVAACNSYYQSQETISALTERVKELEDGILGIFKYADNTMISKADPLYYVREIARALLTPKNNGE